MYGVLHLFFVSIPSPSSARARRVGYACARPADRRWSVVGDAAAAAVAVPAFPSVAGNACATGRQGRRRRNRHPSRQERGQTPLAPFLWAAGAGTPPPRATNPTLPAVDRSAAVPPTAPHHRVVPPTRAVIGAAAPPSPCHRVSLLPPDLRLPWAVPSSGPPSSCPPPNTCPCLPLPHRRRRAAGEAPLACPPRHLNGAPRLPPVPPPRPTRRRRCPMGWPSPPTSTPTMAL